MDGSDRANLYFGEGLEDGERLQTMADTQRAEASPAVCENGHACPQDALAPAGSNAAYISTGAVTNVRLYSGGCRKLLSGRHRRTAILSSSLSPTHNYLQAYAAQDWPGMASQSQLAYGHVHASCAQACDDQACCII